MDIYIPYFYIIQDIRNGMYYAGSKYGKDANPENFMIEGGYQTSSNVIRSIIEEFGLSIFTIRKLKIFTGGEDAYNYETRFLVKINAEHNENFYNSHNNSFYGFGSLGFKRLLIETIGSDNPSSLSWVKKKKEITCLNNHGVKNPFQSPEIRNRINLTNNEKYGGNSPFNSVNVRQKFEENNMLNYGVAWPMQRQDVKDKREVTFLNKYGVNNPLNNPEIKQKSTETMIRKYGFSHPSQMPSSKEVKRLKEQIKLNRSELSILKAYSEKHNIKLSPGWKQRRDSWIFETLRSLYEEFGPL